MKLLKQKPQNRSKHKTISNLFLPPKYFKSSLFCIPTDIPLWATTSRLEHLSSLLLTTLHLLHTLAHCSQTGLVKVLIMQLLSVQSFS